jgi:hypothetical protein
MELKFIPYHTIVGAILSVNSAGYGSWLVEGNVVKQVRNVVELELHQPKREYA